MTASRRPEPPAEGQRTSVFSVLLGFYLDCVEEEEKRSLEVSANPRYRQYLLTPGRPGALFDGEPQLEWAPSESDRAFIERYTALGESSRFLYGYPLYYDSRQQLSPLFFADAELSISEESGRARIVLTHAGSVHLNLHHFHRTHELLPEKLDLQRKLEGDGYGTIDARVSAALELLGIDPPRIAEAEAPRGEPGWKNASVLIRDMGAAFTAQLRRELADLRLRAPSVSRSAVQAFFGGELHEPGPLVPLLEISPLNPSQRKAAEAALSEQITVITGPPGTGKSQVVVAILASMAAADRSVLFASKNNQAVDVVRARLGELLGEADWFLRLGSKASIDEEIERRIEQSRSLEAPARESSVDPEASDDPRGAIEERNAVERAVERRAEELEAYLALGRDLRCVLSELTDPWREWSLGGNTVVWSSPEVARALAGRALEARAHADGRWPGLWPWLKRMLLGSRLLERGQRFVVDSIAQDDAEIPQWKVSRELSWAALATDLDELTRLQRYQDVAAKIERAHEALFDEDSSAELEEALSSASDRVHDVSRRLLCSRLLKRLEENKDRIPTILNKYRDLTERVARLRPGAQAPVQRDFAKAARSLLEVVPGLTVTNLSARRSLPLEPGLFDCVVIDEASQCDIASALPLMVRAKRLVIIGDPQQLRHISSLGEDSEQRIAVERDATDLLTRFSYRKKSLYDLAAETIDERGQAPFFLAEHYRSHPDVIEFSNRVYYQHRLVVRARVEDSSEQAVFWHDVPSRVDSRGGSPKNVDEARAVVDLVRKIVEAPSFSESSTIAVITPFRRQKEWLEDALQDVIGQLAGRLRLGTVHTFQGDEADIVVFSSVVSHGVKPRTAEWISQEEGLLNVALTRARRALHIVGDKAFCRETPGPLGELAEFVEQRQGVAHVARRSAPAVDSVRTIFQELGVWYQEEFPEKTPTRTHYLDFFSVGLSGRRYDIEIDGRQHFYSPEAVAEDDARDAVLSDLGYQVLRFQASDVMRHGEETRQLLARLV